MPNKLSGETSPYLLQHQNNPVDWYPWGPEALARARDEEKPIFLSIGYSSCHWCHVMEHESFEDPRIARLMNEKFVCIKVDREERPDLDQIYMNAVQLMTGHGGWPMSVFLTPDLKPFYGGTYWPPTASRGMPGFDQVLMAVDDAWSNRRDQALAGAEQLTGELEQITRKGAEGVRVPLNADILSAAAHSLERMFDPIYGGFGEAPKFPHPFELQLVLRWWKRSGLDRWWDIVRLSLDKMYQGGMYDHLGGGFARYSVDARWLVPHFEKMLYDNALLAVVYLEAYQVSGEERYRTVVTETLDYLLRDMCDPAGGFYSAEDADSEGVEGKFYVWTASEVREVLGDAAAETFSRVYDITERGNFEGHSIANLPKTIEQQAKLLSRDVEELRTELAASREKLLAVRAKRVRPGLDDKVLVSWNGLAIDAFARAGACLGEERYIAAAKKAADFILANMRDTGGRLLHTWRGGTAKLAAYLDDYTALANALVSLYEATFEERYIAASTELMGIVLARFSGGDDAGFYFTADDHEQLLTRNKDLTDNATPGGNSLAALALIRLGKLTGRSEYLDTAHAILAAAAPLMQQIPMATGEMLIGLDLWVGPTPELVFVGAGANELATSAKRKFLPRALVAAREEATPGAVLDDLFAGRDTAGDVALYVCENHTCQAPVVGRAAIEKAIEKL
ncbi:thioredoxin domain-containing protein [Aeoliella sp. SH292]|uniref:thioredoxin domain-containing protein n=1 Tax=Aeoliella sp. SH292 TaxID=3454464 RepID=UPI003F9C9D36